MRSLSAMKHRKPLIIACLALVLGIWLLRPAQKAAEFSSALPMSEQKKNENAKVSSSSSAAITVTRPGSAASLKEVVGFLANKISHPSPAIPAEEEYLRKFAMKMSAEHIRALEKLVLEPKQAADMRSAGLFLLTQAGPSSLKALSQIAQSSLSSISPRSQDQAYEVSLRVNAVEALDNLVLHHAQGKKEIEAILQNQKDPTVRFLAQMSLDGIRSGHPGKVGRFVDRILVGERN